MATRTPTEQEMYDRKVRLRDNRDENETWKMFFLAALAAVAPTYTARDADPMDEAQAECCADEAAALADAALAVAIERGRA